MKTDNQALRTLFALPPVRESHDTAITVPTIPQQRIVTGDREIDAVLWLHQVVETGNPALIEKATEAIKRISTPMKQIETRYSNLLKQHPDTHVFTLLLATMNFGDLDFRAKRAIERATSKHEALSRFGSIDQLFAYTPAETACVAALDGVKRGKSWFYDEKKAAKKFGLVHTLVPATISDCLHVQGYWKSLYQLRNAVESHDAAPQAYAHETYAFELMAVIPPANGGEALAAFDHIEAEERLENSASPRILRNLVVSGWFRHGERNGQ